MQMYRLSPPRGRAWWRLGPEAARGSAGLGRLSGRTGSPCWTRRLGAAGTPTGPAAPAGSGKAALTSPCRRKRRLRLAVRSEPRRWGSACVRRLFSGGKKYILCVVLVVSGVIPLNGACSEREGERSLPRCFLPSCTLLVPPWFPSRCPCAFKSRVSEEFSVSFLSPDPRPFLCPSVKRPWRRAGAACPPPSPWSPGLVPPLSPACRAPGEAHAQQPPRQRGHGCPAPPRPPSAPWSPPLPPGAGGGRARGGQRQFGLPGAAPGRAAQCRARPAPPPGAVLPPGSPGSAVTACAGRGGCCGPGRTGRTLPSVGVEPGPRPPP